MKTFLRNIFGRFPRLFYALIILSIPFSLPSSYGANIPKIWNLSCENLFFVGREEELQNIDSLFKRGDDKRENAIVALTGGPGFGKTQTAKKFAQKAQGRYQIVWWFDAKQDINGQFENLAAHLNPLLPEKDRMITTTLSKEALVERVKNILRLKNFSYLFIFDNVGDYADVHPFLPFSSRALNKHILLTSRNASLWPKKVSIGKFKRSESLQLMKLTLPHEEGRAMEKLAETLSDFPLGLSIAIGFIRSHPTTCITQYLALYIERTLKKGEPVIPMCSLFVDTYSRNASATLSISLKAIADQAPEALEALFFMSFLHSKDIPEAYVAQWLKGTKSKITSAEVIKALYDQSLIEIRSTSEESKEGHKGTEIHFLSLHDLIHQLIHESIPMEEKKRAVENALIPLLEVFSGSSERFTKKIIKEPIHLLHAQTLCANAKKMGYSSQRLLKLKVAILECLMGGVRDFNSAQPILKEIEEDLKKGLILEPYDEALLKMNQGFFESLFPNFDKAIQFMQEGLSLLNTLNGYPEERLRAITNLIQYYALRGEPDLAVDLIKEGNNIAEALDSPLYYCFFRWAHACVLSDLGKFEESLEVIEKTKKYPQIKTDYPTINHFLLLQQTGNLIKQNKLAKAWKVLKECEDKTREFYQKRKTNTLAHILLCKSFLCMMKKSSFPKALPHLEEALAIYADCFKGEKQYRREGRVHFMLGKAYEIKEDFRKALEEYLRSKAIYDEVLKAQKIDDVSELYVALSLLGIKLKDDALTHQYLKEHITIFGLNHPRTHQLVKYLDDKGIEVL